jgi:hypothetical protein
MDTKFENNRRPAAGNIDALRLAMRRAARVFVVAGTVSLTSALAPGQIMTTTNEQAWRQAIGESAIASFDCLLPGTTVSTQYSSITFSGNAGGTPFVIVYDPGPPFSPPTPPNCMITLPFGHGGGGWAADFDPPVDGVGFWTFDLQEFPAGSWIVLRGPGNVELATLELTPFGPAMWGFDGFISNLSPIARMEIAINLDDFVLFDSIQWGPVQSEMGDLDRDSDLTSVTSQDFSIV